MNSYSLSSDSGRWWWPQAAAGAGAVAAIAAILVVPTTGHAEPEDAVPDEVATVVIDEPRFVRSDDPHARPCFMIRPRWNVALDGPPPVCGTPAKPVHAADRASVIRTWLDYDG